jgi:hypothetical protein
VAPARNPPDPHRIPPPLRAASPIGPSSPPAARIAGRPAGDIFHNFVQLRACERVRGFGCDGAARTAAGGSGCQGTGRRPSSPTRRDRATGFSCLSRPHPPAHGLRHVVLGSADGPAASRGRDASARYTKRRRRRGEVVVRGPGAALAGGWAAGARDHGAHLASAPAGQPAVRPCAPGVRPRPPRARPRAPSGGAGIRGLGNPRPRASAYGRGPGGSALLKGGARSPTRPRLDRGQVRPARRLC